MFTFYCGTQDDPQLFEQQIEPAGQSLSLSLHCSSNRTHWIVLSIGGQHFTQNVPHWLLQQIEPAGQSFSLLLHCSLNQMQVICVSIAGQPLIGLGIILPGVSAHETKDVNDNIIIAISFIFQATCCLNGSWFTEAIVPNN